MKALLAVCLMIATPFVHAQQSPLLPTAPTEVRGKVLEVKDVETYTYLRLMTKDGETWAAVSKEPVKSGAEVTISNVMVMTNFESKSLKKTFPTILFGTLGTTTPSGSNAMAKAHANVASTVVDTRDIRVAKASGKNARTVSEIITKSASLKDKPVSVRGKIVKYNPEIMGKNWVHLRDGSGSEKDGSNDLLVTTNNQAKLGDIVTAQGIVRTNKDFGAGYSYNVLIEEATVTPDTKN